MKSKVRPLLPIHSPYPKQTGRFAQRLSRIISRHDHQSSTRQCKNAYQNHEEIYPSFNCFVLFALCAVHYHRQSMTLGSRSQFFVETHLWRTALRRSLCTRQATTHSHEHDSQGQLFMGNACCAAAYRMLLGGSCY
jgi:hypothetical protein